MMHKTRFVLVLIPVVLASAWLATTELQARERTSVGPPRVGPLEQLRQRDVQIAVWNKALAMDSTSALALGNLAALYTQRARESGEYADYGRAEKLARRSLTSRTQRNGPAFVTLDRKSVV